MVRRFLLFAALGATSGFGGLAGCARPATTPAAEFIVATTDSAFWVTSDAHGVRVRGVPLILARYGNRFHEVFVTDLDSSFTDAVFTGERLYVRDLVTDDSTLIFDDTAIRQLAAQHARENPYAQLLSPDDPDPEDPTITATGETDILELRGPYAVIEHRLSVQTGDSEQDDTVHVVFDLRTGRRTSFVTAAEDSASHDASVVRTFPTIWHRAGYDCLAQRDSNAGTISFMLHDGQQHAWQVLTVNSTPHIYWLEGSAVDSTTRHALMRAFNDAAAYDEAVQYVRFLHPHPSPLPTRRTL